jgi:hypothetical protein
MQPYLQNKSFYAPTFGSAINSRAFACGGYRYGFMNFEKDDEVKGTGNHISFGEYGYDPRTGRRWRPDPMEFKFPWSSPYAAFNNNPIYFIDPSGEEPIKPLVGTASQFRAILDNSPRKVGAFKGQEASNYLKSLGNTEFSWKQMRPLPTQTGYFNNKEGRYVYTEEGGWVDMVHFMFYAGKAYQYKLGRSKNPIGEAVQDGYKQEATDKYAAPHSSYSYEDLPSDKFGADFAVNHFDQNSDLTFGEQVENYLNNVLKATTPENAPNYKDLPATEPDKPTRTNTTTTPVYTKDNP